MEILLTSFSRGGSQPGPDIQMARSLGVRIRSLELPVDSDLSLMKAIEMLDHHLPDAVVCLAPGPPSGAVTVESAVTNEGPIDPSGPARYECTLPVLKIVERMSREGVPAVLSRSPQATIDNRLAYALLRYVSLRGGETWFGRRPPAGLSSLVGLIGVPQDVSTRALALVVEETLAAVEARAGGS